MPDDVPSIEPPVHSDVRFNLRTVLIVMTLFAVTAGISGSQIRGADARQSLQVATFWGAAVVGLIGWSVLAAWWRYRLERRAGHVWLRLRATTRYAPNVGRAIQIPMIVVLIAWVMLGMIAATSAIGNEPRQPSQSLAFFAAAGLWAMILIPCILSSFWNWKVRLCTNGVLHADRFLPWRNIHGYHWHPRHSDVLILAPRWRRRAAMIVPLEQREAVETLLREKLGK